jgi:hypothetical protein
MPGKITRALVTAAAATCAVLAPIAPAAASPARITVGAAPGVVKVGPKQFFLGVVNGKLSKAVIRVICPGPANSGHPLPRQSAGIEVPPSAAQGGYTGTSAASIGAWLTWPGSAAPSPAYIATLTSYRSVRIPTGITVPCSGSGQMLFLPAPGSPTVKAATVDVTFANIGG